MIACEKAKKEAETNRLKQQSSVQSEPSAEVIAPLEPIPSAQEPLDRLIY